ncbi:MAG TPA: DUF2510 domain-containing protein [Propionicimonas sp.]|uniref:DUF2510 domain-containing protein n=1 Tax=Propionicimonas sp. TaxID=1955623 RepID=UPI002F3F0932
MSSSAGWYPDPGGQAGLFRYWTGAAWTAAVTSNPQATPPPTGAGEPQGFGPAGGLPGGGYQGGSGYQGASGYQASTGYQGAPGYPQGGGSGYPQAGTTYSAGTQPGRRKATGWWIAGGAALLVVLLVIWFITQSGTGTIIPGIPAQPSGTASANICPKPDSTATATAPAQANDGRVHGGKISYPMLGAPWGEVTGDNRVPFGRDVASQNVVQEDNYDGEGHSWVSSVLIGELVAGDGFFSPKEGSEIVMKCVVGEFYGDAVVARKDTTSKQITVDGKDAWYLESHLTFDIPNLITKGETAIVVIVDTGADSSSLYYASIPDTADPTLMTDARNLVGKLKVSA